ncbi:MAG: FAD-dependent oxidoreductase [Gemmatimonadales bacterium]
MTESSPLRVAVVGAGPAGFFLTDKLLSQTTRPVTVDLFERLPVPYGLVRFGVAPDHEKIKAVTRSFDKAAARPGFRYFGNVEVGRDVSVAELRRHYHAVVFTSGAQSDRRMGIPGEDLEGSHPATEFVAWYNGHPDYADRAFNLAARRVAVIGVGNVAVDVARILCRTDEELARTDLADHALEALRHRQVREVHLLGRRGPAQAAFTTPEVKELGELTDTDTVAFPNEVALDPLSTAEVEAANDASERRKIEVLGEFGTRQPTGKPRRLTLRFLVSPVEILGDDAGRVRAIRLARNRLVERGGKLAAEPTGETEELPVELVFRSVGYRGVPIEGVPFDERSGTIPNVGGRVTEAAGGAVVPGIYTAGWIKRGPSGVVGTNKPDAGETADAILADADQLLAPPANSPELIAMLVQTRQPDFVDWAAWQRIAARENEEGKRTGRPRRKLCRVPDLVAAARG